MAWAWEQKGLSAVQKLVLLGLASYANSDDETAFPSLQRLAKDCGLSVAAVRNAIRYMEEKQLLSKEMRRRQDGSYSSNLYRLGVVNQVEGGSKRGVVGSKRGVVGVVNVVEGTLYDVEGTLYHVEEGSIPRIVQEPVIEPVKEPVKEPVNRISKRNTVNGANAPDPRVKDILVKTAEFIGYDIPNWGKEGKAVKDILSKGYTPEEILDCYRWLKDDKFWANKFLPFSSVKTQIGEFTKMECKTNKDSQASLDTRRYIEEELAAKEAFLRDHNGS